MDGLNSTMTAQSTAKSASISVTNQPSKLVDGDFFRNLLVRSLLSILPKILESIRRHFGISNCVHDILVAHIVLEGAGVMPIIGELVAG
jgi:hypothetical protein